MIVKPNPHLVEILDRIADQAEAIADEMKFRHWFEMQAKWQDISNRMRAVAGEYS